MHDERDLSYSSLQQTYSTAGRQRDIYIYRSPETGWSLEVVHEHNKSIVWDDELEANEAALVAALPEPNDAEIAAFIGKVSDERAY